MTRIEHLAAKERLLVDRFNAGAESGANRDAQRRTQLVHGAVRALLTIEQVREQLASILKVGDWTPAKAEAVECKAELLRAFSNQAFERLNLLRDEDRKWIDA